jgi:hypothetical protein
MTELEKSPFGCPLSITNDSNNDYQWLLKPIGKTQ